MCRQTSTPDKRPLIQRIKELKDQTLGNESKKQTLLSSNVLPNLLSLFQQTSDTDLLIELTPLLTSLAYNRSAVCAELLKNGVHTRLAQLLASQHSTNALIECSLRSLKSLFRSRRHAMEITHALLQTHCVSVLVRLILTSMPEQTVCILLRGFVVIVLRM